MLTRPHTGWNIVENVQNKVAVVTGAASGIGLGIVRALAGAGVHTAMLDIEESALDASHSQFATANVDVQKYVCDVSDRDSIGETAGDIQRHFGRVDIVCNNAGVAAGGPIDEIANDDWDWVLGVNLFGVINGMKTFTPIMKDGGEGGHFVNTASILGLWAGGGMSAYCASKYAVVAISECARNDLAPFGIGVSALCPGMINTRILRSERNRPRFESSRPSPMFEGRREIEQRFAEQGLDPDIVGEQVLDGIRKDKAFIFTHANLVHGIRDRMERVLASFDGSEVEDSEHPAF